MRHLRAASGMGSFGGVGVSVGAPVCGVEAGVVSSEQLFSALGGSLSSLAQSTASGVSIFGPGSSTADAKSRAVMTAGVLDLGAYARDEFSGASDANTVKGGMALGLWDRPFTAPSGTTSVRVNDTFDGNQTITGRGQTGSGSRVPQERRTVAIRLSSK